MGQTVRHCPESLVQVDDHVLLVVLRHRGDRLVVVVGHEVIVLTKTA